MPSSKHPWLIALVLVVLVAGAYVVLDRTVLDDDPEAGDRRATVTLPEDPVGSGDDEPRRTRVHVDNSGPRVAVSVRTGRRPWTDTLAVTVNGNETLVRRDGDVEGGACAPTVTAEPTSLLTRLTFERSCLTEPATVRVRVAVDGAEPVRARAEETARPNVLMIMVDDMRTDELRFMPNVQELLGEQGVTFANGFAGFPLCCPARASVLNGQLTHNHGVWSHEEPWGFTALRDEQLLPVWLRDGGYATTYLGKYLNGYGKNPAPGRDQGTSTQYVPPGWDLWRGSVDGGMPAGHPDDGGTYRFFDTTLNDNGDGYLPLQGQYQTRAYARLTRETIADLSASDDPFFSYVSFTAPHHGGPREQDDPPDLVTPARPKELWGAFDDVLEEAPGASWKDPDRSDKPKRVKRNLSDDLLEQVRDAARQRAESIYVVDQSVRQIVGALRESGELDDTLVVFTSDNGYFQGEQGRPEGKILPYEPSLRVPVVMRGPGIPRGEVRTDPFLSIDWAPTFADLADVDPVLEVDGRSLLDVARLGDESNRDTWSRVVLTETDPIDAVQADVAAEDPIGARTDELLRGRVTGIRTGRYLYTEWQPEPDEADPGVLVELYDVRKDPEQYHNLAEDPEQAEVVALLAGVLEEAIACAGEECSSQLLPEQLR